MIEIITAVAFVFAWVVFRYERYAAWQAEVKAAHGILRALHHGMVQGLTPNQAVGWGQIYFSTVYTPEVALRRAVETGRAIERRRVDQVFLVPTEPLERLATVPPRWELIRPETVAVANFALWRVKAFNQLVQQLTDFNTAHLHEIRDSNTAPERRRVLASAASLVSLMLHRDGIGDAWAPGGWYRALIERVSVNIGDLMELEGWSWRRYFRAWPLMVLDALALGGLVAVIVKVIV